jgi:RHS repeat-associated protein
MIIGSQSYNYAIPILNLPGRAGMDLNLTLHYNSRVWDIDAVNGTATFNADRDIPSYGFRLNYGDLEYDPNDDLYIVTERDGTKHVLVNNGGYNSTDGSYISYNSTTRLLTYRNGITVSYPGIPSNNVYRPSQIKDTNGNNITFTYARFPGNNILAITDTLGRVIVFHYDVNNLLSYIDQNVAVSSVDPSGVHRYVTFTWAALYGTGAPWYNFSGLTVIGTPALTTPLNVLTGCTYANNTGYRFTYGDWAIINKIESLSASGLTRNYVSYNYPAASAGSQTDAPTYTQQTMSPDGSTTNTSVWAYAATKAGTGIVTSMKVTDPIGNITVTNIDQSTALLSSLQMKSSSGAILQTSTYTWATSGGATVPSTIATTLNDTGQQSSVQYSNYDAFGNAGDVYDYDFGGQLLRHTVTSYATTQFAAQHILNLPTQIIIKDGAGNIAARTDIAYDTTAVTSVTDAAHHDSSTVGHGNPTLITRYTNASAGTGAIARHLFYDSLGNVRTAELDCCSQKLFSFSVALQYAYPTSVTRGPSGLQFITSEIFNFDKGLVVSATDENGQATQYQYDTMNRLTTTTLPPQGATTVSINTAYDDSSASPSVTKSTSPSGVTMPITVTTMDGMSHILQVDTKNGSTVVSSTQYKYDKLFKQVQISNPYAPGDTIVYTGTTYDALGRRTQVTPPSGGFTQYNYSGNAVTTTDPAGKQRKNYSDALGRLIEVDEPGLTNQPANNGATLQTDGNFVIYDPLHNAVWSSGTSGTNGGPITLQDDGNLVIYHELWQAGTYRASSATIAYDACRVGNALRPGQTLTEGQCLESTSGMTFAQMNSGELQIYDRVLGELTWVSGTYGHPGGYAVMQSDGNFVIYSSTNVALWSTGSSGSGATLVELETDGRLILYNPVWSSGTTQSPVTGTLTHPACDVGTGTGWTGVLGPGSCFVSPNGHYQLLMQTDGNLVLSNIGVAPAAILWESNTAITPFSKAVTFVTTYLHDPLGNLTSVSQASGVVNGVPASGQIRSYAYDSLSRVTSTTTPESGIVTNYYVNSSGSCAGDPSLICQTTDARGVTKNFTYDGDNRITGVQYTNDPANTAAVTYQYDTGGAAAFALNRLTTITEGPTTPTPLNSHVFTYDNLGRIITDSQSIDQHTFTIHYSYNFAGQLSSITYPSGRIVQQNHDAIGRINSVVSGSTTYMNGLTFNAAGEAAALTLGNGVQGAFTYNNRLQPATLRYFKTGTTTDILNLSYDYTSSIQPNNNGQIQAMHYFTQPGTEDKTKSESFAYDQLGRLNAAQTITVNGTAGTWSLQWGYDRFGNRFSQTLVGGNVSIGQPQLTVDPNTNRITSSGYTYDAAGNMTHDASAAYAYDGNDRLTQINTTAAVYSYFGPFRIKKIVGSTTTRYVYAGSKPIAEYVNGATTPSAEYIYSGSQLLATIAGSNTTYHHPDHLSNRAETDASGNRIRTFGQFPFGETWYETGIVDKWKFTGDERDSATGETGLDYAIYRYYSSGLGRFMSPDYLAGHSRRPQSLNRYAYTTDPINKFDPLGLDDGDDGGGTPVTAMCEDGFCSAFEVVEVTPSFDCPALAECEVIDPSLFAQTPSRAPNFPVGNGAPMLGNPLADRLALIQSIIKQILNGNNLCADFMNSMANVFFGQSAGQIYNGTQVNVGESYNSDGSYSGVGGTSQELSALSDNSMTVYTNSPFGRLMQPANYGQPGPPGILKLGDFFGGSLGAQVAIEMHELAHIVGAIPSDGFGADPSRTQESANKDTMSKNCDDAIKNAVSNIAP